MGKIYSQKDKKHFLGTLQELGAFYKNFHKVFVAKTFFQFISYILAFLIVIPASVILGGMMLLDPIPWFQIISQILGGNNMSLELGQEILNHPILVLLYGFFLLIVTIIVYLTLSYTVYLFIQMSVKFHEHKKQHYFPYKYITFKSWRRFIAVSCILFLISLGMLFALLVPVSIVILMWNVGILPLSVFNVLRLLFVFIAGCAVIYMAYRLLYAYILIAQDHHISAWKSLKKSWKRTRGIGGALNFLAMLFLIAIIHAPFVFVGMNLENRVNNYQSEIQELYGYQLEREESERSYDEIIILQDEQRSAVWILYMYNIVYGFLFSGLSVFALSFFYLNHNKKS